MIYQQGELAFSAQGDKLIYYSGKKRLGWFSHQKSVIFTYQLGYDGKMAKNVLTTTISIPPSDASLPGSSVGISEDGRFLYYTKDQLYKTGGYAAHTGRYDTRNGNHTIVSNYAGDLRYTFVSQGDYSTEGMLLIQADTKSQTGHSYEENDAGTTLVDAHTATLGSSSGRVHHLPAQVYVLFGMSAKEGISVRHTGQKRYELSDHLGNVTVVVTDRKKAVVSGSAVVTAASVQSYTNYYAFGMSITARSGTDGPGYRYGFNGMEKDNDVESGAYDFGARIYDARIAKFMSVDPDMKMYPYYSPYLFAGNSPILFIDVKGRGPGFWNTALDVTQLGLGILGFIPGAGEIADAANAGISALRGDVVGTGLSLASAIPLAGWVPGATGLGRRALLMSSKHSDEVIEASVRTFDNAPTTSNKVPEVVDGFIDPDKTYEIGEVIVQESLVSRTRKSIGKGEKGVYEIWFVDGSKYIGESKNIYKRLGQHFGSMGKFSGEAGSVTRIDVYSTGKSNVLQREILEQKVININNFNEEILRNRKNPISNEFQKTLQKTGHWDKVKIKE